MSEVSEVKRYKMDAIGEFGDMRASVIAEEDDSGHWVKFTDFDRLAKRCANLSARVAELEKSPEIIAQLEDEKRVFGERCAALEARCAERDNTISSLQKSLDVAEATRSGEAFEGALADEMWKKHVRELEALLGRCAQQVKRFRSLQTAYGVNDEKVSALLKDLEKKP